MAQKAKRQLKSAVPEKKAEKPKQKRAIWRIVFAPFKIFKFLVPRYFKNAWRELRQVKWPTRKETIQLTLAVFAFALVFGTLITITDYGLDRLFKRLLLK